MPPQTRWSPPVPGDSGFRTPRGSDVAAGPITPCGFGEERNRFFFFLSLVTRMESPLKKTGSPHASGLEGRHALPDSWTACKVNVLSRQL